MRVLSGISLQTTLLFSLWEILDPVNNNNSHHCHCNNNNYNTACWCVGIMLNFEAHKQFRLLCVTYTLTMYRPVASSSMKYQHSPHWTFRFNDDETHQCAITAAERLTIAISINTHHPKRIRITHHIIDTIGNRQLFRCIYDVITSMLTGLLHCSLWKLLRASV